MKKYAETLAKEYELGDQSYDFFSYIVDSMINGNRDQVRRLFSEMKKSDQAEFLINYLDVTIGFQKSVLNTCIKVLTNQ